jgi:hypothetical protein
MGKKVSLLSPLAPGEIRKLPVNTIYVSNISLTPAALLIS